MKAKLERLQAMEVRKHGRWKQSNGTVIGNTGTQYCTIVGSKRKAERTLEDKTNIKGHDCKVVIHLRGDLSKQEVRISEEH